jgi:hypothetical protein
MVGSTKFKRSWINYDPTDLKNIRMIWQELTGKEFKPDSKIPLDELVALEVGPSLNKVAYEELKPHFYVTKGVMYLTRAGNAIELNRTTKPLAEMAYALNGNKFFVKDNLLYLSSGKTLF